MKDTVIITFGRMQGPHRGHEMLFNEMRSMAEARDADYIIYPSLTEDKKNPLSPGIKKLLLEYLLPEHKDNIEFNHENNIVKILEQLQTRYKNVVFVCGSDRANSFRNFLPRYNGDLYSFESLDIVGVGNERNDDAAGIEGSSASKMREYCRTNNYKDFLINAPRNTTRWDVRVAYEVMKLYIERNEK